MLGHGTIHKFSASTMGNADDMVALHTELSMERYSKF